MNSLNVQMKLKLLSLVLVLAMVLCVSPVALADWLDDIKPWEDLPLPVTTMDGTIVAPLVTHVSGEVIIGLDPNATSSDAASSASSVGGYVVKKLNLRNRNVYLLRLTGEVSEDSAISQLKNNNKVIYAEENALFYAAGWPVMPNDPEYAHYEYPYRFQWALSNDIPGLSGDGDIDATEGWYHINAALTGGIGHLSDSNIVIAVLDTGADLDHHDLDGVLGTGIYAGYDYVNTDSSPADDHNPGHGTHIAGIIGAETNNSVHVVGVTYGEITIMPIKVLGSNGTGTAADIAEGINHAADPEHFADVICMAFSGYSYSTAVKDAVEAAFDAGCTLVAAAGDDWGSTDGDGLDLEYYPTYPACYATDKIICVAASDYLDNHTPHSNYGSTYVDLTAPGGTDVYILNPRCPEKAMIRSTVNGGDTGNMHGTSQACAFVAGAAGLVKALNPDLTGDIVQAILKEKFVEDVIGDSRYGTGRLTLKGTEFPLSMDANKVAGGEEHTLILMDGGKVWACGSNGYGQLGNDNQGYSEYLRDKTLNEAGTAQLSNISDIDAGWYHSLAVDSTDGYVWAWGYNTNGQIGNGDTVGTVYDKPVKVLKGEMGTATYLEDIVQVAAGRSGEYSLARDNTADKYVWAWGYNWYGQLGNGKNYSDYSPNPANETTPVQVHGGEMNTTYLKDIIQVDAAIWHSIALDKNGYVWTWGENYDGELGNDSYTSSKTPVKVHGGDMGGDQLQNITDIAIGPYSPSYAVDSINGYVWAWGSGYGDHPVKVEDGEQTPGQSDYLQGIVSISVGNNCVVALDSSGNVWAWGYYPGNGSSYSYTPVQVKKNSSTNLTNIVYVDAGYSHSEAIDSSGKIWVWGYNGYGQLGLGNTNDYLYATPMP